MAKALESTDEGLEANIYRHTSTAGSMPHDTEASLAAELSL